MVPGSHSKDTFSDGVSCFVSPQAFLCSCDEFSVTSGDNIIFEVSLKSEMGPATSSTRASAVGATDVRVDSESAAKQALDDIRLQVRSQESSSHHVLFLDVTFDGSGNPQVLRIAESAATRVWHCDILKLGMPEVSSLVLALLQEASATTVMHDISHMVLLAGSSFFLRHTIEWLDLQVGFELLGHGPGQSVSKIAETMSVSITKTGSSRRKNLKKGRVNAAQHSQENSSSATPASRSTVLLPSDLQTSSLLAIYSQLSKDIKEKKGLTMMWKQVSHLKALRCSKVESPIRNSAAIGFRQLKYSVAGIDLLECEKCAVDTKIVPCDESEIESLLSLLPYNWGNVIRGDDRLLLDIEMDLGRMPFATFHTGKRLRLSDEEDPVVTEELIESVMNGLLTSPGEIGSDNRVGIDGQLHRISFLKDKNTDVIGATLRVGRQIMGLGSIITDLLVGEKYAAKSILVLGSVASGKTSLLRSSAAIVAESRNVMVVDSSCEIGGPGRVPHQSIGLARRMIVPRGKDMLRHSLIEALETHSPDTLVLDELSSDGEVYAAGTAKNRGVRLLASAHGNLRSLVRNHDLRGLIGGVEYVTIGDGLASGRGGVFGNGFRKTAPERKRSPIFDCIVELGIVKDDISACRIVTDTRRAVDYILAGKEYEHECEIRRRTPEGSILVEKGSCGATELGTDF